MADAAPERTAAAGPSRAGSKIDSTGFRLSLRGSKALNRAGHATSAASATRASISAAMATFRHLKTIENRADHGVGARGGRASAASSTSNTRENGICPSVAAPTNRKANGRRSSILWCRRHALSAMAADGETQI